MKELSSFQELGMSQESLQAVTEMGFTTPSPIQSQAIPKLLKGSDLIGQAQTGTGKTAAFGIPLLDSIQKSNPGLQGLVLCPTRELAVQVSKELGKLAGSRNYIRILPVYGGDSIQKQMRSIKDGVQIIVGTPGRLMDLMSRKILKLDTVRMAILDEADEMLNMGFRDDMEEILGEIPDTRQTVLFSATMSKPIMDIASRYLQKPVHIKVTGKEVTNSRIEQSYVQVKLEEKPKLLASLVRHYSMKSVIVFCNTKKAVDDTVSALRASGLKSEAIHGDLNQAQRNHVLSAFRSGKLSVLVATDVAARGIDVSDVDAVFNYDVPMDRESYVHRIGRTGRAGKEGRAISLVSNSSDLRKIRGIENFSQVDMKNMSPPTAKEVRASYVNQMRDIQDSMIANQNFDHHRTLVQEMKEAGLDTDELLAYFLRMNCPLEVVDGRLNLSESGDRSKSYGKYGKGGGSQGSSRGYKPTAPNRRFKQAASKKKSPSYR